MPNRIAKNYTSGNVLDLISVPQTSEEHDMTTRFRDVPIREGWSLLWPFLLIACGGILLRGITPWLPLPWWITKDVVSAISDAVIVAGIIGFALELFATHYLIERVSADLSEKLVGRGLPSELQSLISEVVKTAIVREQFVKVYRVRPVGAGSIQLDMTLSFIAKNYSDSPKMYAPKFQDETFYDPKVLSMEYGLLGQSRENETVEINDDVTKVKTVKGKREIKLEPFLKNDRAICEVVMRYSLKMPDTYSEITSFGEATIGAVLRTESVPEDLDFVSSGETTATVHKNGDKTWHFDKPYITNQHIRVWWFKKASITP